MQSRTKATKLFRCMLVNGIILFGFITTAMASDMTEYKRIAENTIKQAQSGRIENIDKLIAQQQKLMQIGIEACNKYIKKHPDSADILKLVISNADNMKTLSLSEIEEKWHHGGELKKNGYEMQEDHFGKVGNLIDAVIHPATTYIALNNFKSNGDKAYLEQVVAELSEVLVHIEFLDN